MPETDIFERRTLINARSDKDVPASVEAEARVSPSLSFATGAIDNPPRLINTRPVSKGLHYKGV